MKHTTHIIVAALTLLAFSASLQARDDQPRIYINPGHGGWGPDDRPFATISHPATSTGRPDTCGFYESNTDLWKELLTVLKPHKYSFVWVRGHNGHPENERCDKLATAFAAKYKSEKENNP